MHIVRTYRHICIECTGSDTSVSQSTLEKMTPGMASFRSAEFVGVEQFLQLSCRGKGPDRRSVLADAATNLDLGSVPDSLQCPGLPRVVGG